MAIVDSLKKLLVKFGGNPSALEENATSSDVIDAISEAYTDKEGTYTEVTPIVTEGTKIATITTNNTAHDIYVPKELPAVTSEDEDAILAVDYSGKWKKGIKIPYIPSSYKGRKVVINSDGDGFAYIPDTFEYENLRIRGNSFPFYIERKVGSSWQNLSYADLEELDDMLFNITTQDDLSTITNIPHFYLDDADRTEIFIIEFTGYDKTTEKPVKLYYKAQGREAILENDAQFRKVE